MDVGVQLADKLVSNHVSAAWTTGVNSISPFSVQYHLAV
jgi:hypothetical protein